MNLTEVMMLETSKPKKKPDGTYIGVKFSRKTQNAIKSFMKELGVPLPISREKMHTTLIYSRKYFVYEDEKLGKIDPPWIGKPKKLTIWETRDEKKSKALVLIYDCAEMDKEHKRIMKEYGATYDFPEYHSHITLTYDCGDFAIPKNIDFDGLLSEIEIVEEYVTDLVLNWQNKE